MTDQQNPQQQPGSYQPIPPEQNPYEQAQAAKDAADGVNTSSTPQSSEQQPNQQQSYQQPCQQQQPYGQPNQQVGQQSEEPNQPYQPYNQPLDPKPQSYQQPCQQQQPYGQPYQQPLEPKPQGWQPYQQGVPAKNHMTSSTVCGMMAIIIGFLSPLGAFILGAVAIVFAQKDKKAFGPQGYSRVGFVCGIIGIVIGFVIWMISIAMIMSDPSAYMSSLSSSSSSSSSLF